MSQPQEQASSQGAAPGTTLEQKYEMGIQILYNICSIFTVPVEYGLRYQFGTRYFNLIAQALAVALMIALPIIDTLLGGMTSMLSFGMAHRRVTGMFTMGNLSFYFLIANAIHTWRLWRLMRNPQKEYYGAWEGPALPFFKLLPNGESYWVVRTVYEPLFVVVLAWVLGHLGILDSFASGYLTWAGCMLFVKEAIEWYRSWLTIRMTIDAGVKASLLEKYLNGNATDSELAYIHIARPPKSTPAAAHEKVAENMSSGLPSDLQRLVTPAEPNAAPEPRPAAAPFSVVRNPEAGFITLDTPRAKFGALAILAVGYLLISNGTLQRLVLPQQPDAQYRKMSPLAARVPVPGKTPSVAIPATPSAASSNAAAAASPDEETAASAPASLTGKWAGSVNTDTSICQLSLEVRNNTDYPGIKGFGTMRCVKLGPLVSAQVKGRMDQAFNVIRQTTPTALQLSGRMRRDGAIRFHVDAIVGPPPEDPACKMQWLKISPFGNQLLTQWEDGCKGGQAMLGRTGS